VPTDAYLATIARNVGVSELWIEDAIQELRIAEWQGRRFRHVAIDFVREYGPYSRSGTPQGYSYLDGEDQASADWTVQSDALIDLESVFPTLKAAQRAALIRHYRGFKQTAQEANYCRNGRQALRKRI